MWIYAYNIGVDPTNKTTNIDSKNRDNEDSRQRIIDLQAELESINDQIKLLKTKIDDGTYFDEEILKYTLMLNAATAKINEKSSTIYNAYDNGLIKATFNPEHFKTLFKNDSTLFKQLKADIKTAYSEIITQQLVLDDTVNTDDDNESVKYNLTDMIRQVETIVDTLNLALVDSKLKKDIIINKLVQLIDKCTEQNAKIQLSEYIKIHAEILTKENIEYLKSIHDKFLESIRLTLDNSDTNKFATIITMLNEDDKICRSLPPTLETNKVEKIKKDPNLLYWKVTDFKTKIQNYLEILKTYKMFKTNHIDHPDSQEYKKDRQKLTKDILNYIILLYTNNEKSFDFVTLSDDEFFFFAEFVKSFTQKSPKLSDDNIRRLENQFKDYKSNILHSIELSFASFKLLKKVIDATVTKSYPYEMVIKAAGKLNMVREFEFSWPSNKLIIMIHLIWESLENRDKKFNGFLGLEYTKIGGGRSKTLKKKKNT